MKTARLELFKKHSADAFDHLRDDPDEAARIDAMSDEAFAEERGIEIVNPSWRKISMARKSREDLLDEVKDLKSQLTDAEEENESLSDQLDSIRDVLEDDSSESSDDDE